MEVNTEKIAVLLKKVGVKPALSCWRALTEGIQMCIEKPDILWCGVTKVLYPNIAKKIGGTPSSVERNIRHAITDAFKNMPLNVMKAVFGYSIDTERTCATNSEFIGALAQVIADEPNNPVWSM